MLVEQVYGFAYSHCKPPSLQPLSSGASLQMGRRIDFLQCLEIDMALKILTSLDDPSDLVRASAVSCSWRHFVIANGLCKQLCLRLFRPSRSIDYVLESSWRTKQSADIGPRDSVEWQDLEKEHRAYAFLVRALTTFEEGNCIHEAISASSTDNFPEESIRNTLDPRDRIHRRASYWSSKGQRDPAVPETLIFKLVANLCVITEISVQPFQAYFQSGLPIYSAKFVRFRTGHPLSPTFTETDLKDLPLQLPADDQFVWTYTSQEFPMAQEKCLQTFKLPEPVLCIGGYLQIELLGRVQTQEMDSLFYICVSHVQVRGRSLFPAFDAELLLPSGKFLLRYHPDAPECTPHLSPYSQLAASPNLVQENLGGLEQLLNVLHGNALDLEPDDWDDDDIDMLVI